MCLAERSRDAMVRVQSRAGRLLGAQGRSGTSRCLRRGPHGACRGGGVEHSLDDRRILLAVGAFAELAAEIGGADCRDGLDSMVGGRGGDHVAARGADTQRADTLSARLVAHAEERHRSLDVLDPVGGVLKPARLALALTLEGGVPRQVTKPSAARRSAYRPAACSLTPLCGMGLTAMRLGRGPPDHCRPGCTGVRRGSGRRWER